MLVGLKLTAIVGVSVTVAEEEIAVFAWLVAVTITVCCELIVEGAVYNPDALIVPTPLGLSDHVTAVLVVFVTVAANCVVCWACNVALEGFTLTVTGA